MESFDVMKMLNFISQASFLDINWETSESQVIMRVISNKGEAYFWSIKKNIIFKGYAS